MLVASWKCQAESSQTRTFWEPRNCASWRGAESSVNRNAGCPSTHLRGPGRYWWWVDLWSPGECHIQQAAPAQLQITAVTHGGPFWGAALEGALACFFLWFSGLCMEPALLPQAADPSVRGFRRRHGLL